MDFSVFANATFLFSRFELKKTLYVVFSYLFANLPFDIVVRTNHHDVASRGAVGRTHTIVRLETRIRRKDGTENFGGLVYVLDGFPQRDFVLWVLMCPINFILYFLICLLSCLFSGYHAKGYHAPSILHGLSRPGLSRLYHHCTATTPVYICPGYHAIVLSPIPGLSHLSYHAPPHTYIGLSHPP